MADNRTPKNICQAFFSYVKNSVDKPLKPVLHSDHEKTNNI
jgi:hypothetical protein